MSLKQTLFYFLQVLIIPTNYSGIKLVSDAYLSNGIINFLEVLLTIEPNSFILYGPLQ